MAALSSSQSPGIFLFTKLRLFIAFSLALTWWISSLLPQYQPAIRQHLASRLDEARQKIPSIKIDWTPTPHPRDAYNASKVAMIIETRILPHLVPQLLHMITVVPPDWRFLFIGSDKSVTLLGRSASINHQQVIGKLDLMVLPEPWDISSKELVDRTLTDMRFYDEFLPGVEWILKFEYDSILCANSDDSLNNWLHWHWTGAPRMANDHFSGNGGLSLRRVSAIRQVLAFQARFNDSEPEDEWFGKRLYVMPGLNVAAGLDEALAVENVYKERPMGFHVPEMGKRLAPEVWDNHDTRMAIFQYCPEIHMVLDGKLERERCPGDGLDGVIHPTPEEVEAENKKKQAEEEAKKSAKGDAVEQLQAERKMAEAAEAKGAANSGPETKEASAADSPASRPEGTTDKPDEAAADHDKHRAADSDSNQSKTASGENHPQ